MNHQRQHIEDPDYDQMTDEVLAEDLESSENFEDSEDSERSENTENSEKPSKASIKEAIQEAAREDEKPASSSFTLREILGGDILSTKFLRQQIWLILLVAIFLIIYVGNRYSCQKKMLTINHLNKELVVQRYKMLSISSELTERCRETQVLQMLRENNDTTLHISDLPPYVIEIPEE